jgi:hypothetical protein
VIGVVAGTFLLVLAGILLVIAAVKEKNEDKAI